MSPPSSKTRNSRSATWTVTTCRAWESPTCTRSPATWIWPRWETLRRTTTGPCGTTRPPRASLAPCSLARVAAWTGEGSDRTSAPSASTCMVAASRRSVTVCPANGSPTETCRPATPTVPPALTRRVTSIPSPSPTARWAAPLAGAGPAGRAPASRPWPRSCGCRRHGRVLSSRPSRLTCMVAPSSRTWTVWPASRRPSQTCRPATPRFPHAGTRASTSRGRRPLGWSLPGSPGRPVASGLRPARLPAARHAGGRGRLAATPAAPPPHPDRGGRGRA